MLVPIRHMRAFLLCGFLAAWIASVHGNRIMMGYMTGSKLPDNSTNFYTRPGGVISGAITYAVESVNNSPYVLPNHTLQFVIAETYGLETESIKETVLLLDKNISVYIGPQETCKHEGRIAAAFNLPMISYYCSDPETSDKEMYPTFARTKPPDSQISRSVVTVLKLFNWTKVTFLHSSQYVHIADTLCELFEQNDINITFRRVYQSPYFHQHSENPFIKIVTETHIDTRIYVMLGAYFEFVGLMDHLYETGLLDSGDYFVVGVDVEQYGHKDQLKYMTGIFQTTVTKRTTDAFKYFVGVVPSPPILPEYDLFNTEVNRYLEAPPFNFANPFNIPKLIRPEAAYLYDAVWLYARAAHAVIENNPEHWRNAIRNGTKIIEKIKGMKYKGAIGYMSRINSVGDAEGNYSFVARRPIPDHPDKWGIIPVGAFQLDENPSELPDLHFYDDDGIDWASGHPPLDEPPCGYRQEKCIPPTVNSNESQPMSMVSTPVEDSQSPSKPTEPAQLANVTAPSDLPTESSNSTKNSEPYQASSSKLNRKCTKYTQSDVLALQCEVLANQLEQQEQEKEHMELESEKLKLQIKLLQLVIKDNEPLDGLNATQLLCL